MLRRLVRHRPSPSMMVALVALFVALGGTSFAAVALKKNSVGSKQIKANAVLSSKIKNGAVGNGDLAGNSVDGTKLLDGSVGGSDLADNAVTSGKIANNSVNAAKVADNSLGQSDVQGGYLPASAPAPRGTTLKGDWALRTIAVANQRMQTAISYGALHLAAAPTAHYIPAGGPTPPGCTGDSNNPGADPGNLCVFESVQNNITAGTQTTFNAAGADGVADPWGAGIAATATAGSGGSPVDTRFRGSFAVTAP